MIRWLSLLLSVALGAGAIPPAALRAETAAPDIAAALADLRALVDARAQRQRQPVDPPASPSASVRWFSDHADRVAAAALRVIAAHPADPRRWEAVVVALQTNRPCVVAINADYDEAVAARDHAAIQAALVRDEAARTAWLTRQDELLAELLAATDVAPAALADGLVAAVYRETTRPGGSRWPQLAELVDIMLQRVDQPEALVRALEISSRVAERTAPAAYGALVKRLTDHRLPPVAGWAQGKANLLAAQEEAFVMRFTALDGREVDVARLRGKVVLIDFWATWCGPCKAELPNILENYRRFHDQGFEVIAVSLDREADREKLEAYVAENNLPWPQHFDGLGWKNTFAVQYGVRAIPAMFLLDREGRIAATQARGAKLEAEIRRLLSL